MAQPLPTLRQLSYLLALARRRSFSKAAEDCLVSQSTLSAGVRELERLLGGRVVDRGGREIALTPLGEQAAARARTIMGEAEELVRLAHRREPLSGAFRLGLIPTIGPFLLPAALPELKKTYPDLQLYLREDLTAGLIGDLTAGQIDAAILAFPYEAAGIEFHDIGADEFVFAASREHVARLPAKLRPSDLDAEELLLLEDGHCLRDHAIAACKLLSPGRLKAFGATSLFTLVQMTAAGLGATLLPELAIAGGLSLGDGIAIRRFVKPAPQRRIGVAWRAGSGRAQEARLLANVFAAALRSLESRRPG